MNNVFSSHSLNIAEELKSAGFTIFVFVPQLKYFEYAPNLTAQCLLRNKISGIMSAW